ncbi:MAG: cytochrome c oxidase subunit 3 [Rhodomicrobium sp.]|nr:cytochrome c oxidase subunit 3 [Rhodomicrobium sp.]
MADSHAKHHDYHLVDPSPWPLVGSIAAFVMAIGAIAWMKTGNGGLFGFEGPWIFAAGMLGILATMVLWWRDVIAEAEHKKLHTPVVQMHLRYGMILFIASEVMFFVAWFWAYFDVALFPDAVQQLPGTNEMVGVVGREEVTGGKWPPVPTEDGRFSSTFDPWTLPLLNTLILLTSGTTVTWAHYALQEGNRRGLIWGLALTIVLGILFTCLQAYEYQHADFQFAGHIYGSTFFMATGFHGFHVIVGTIFLTVILFRALAGHFTEKHHFGFEAAAWYWHFVDVVWLFLFVSIYVWGAGASAGH